MFRRAIRWILDRAFLPYERRILATLEHREKTSPAVKVAQRQLYHQYRRLFASGTPPTLSEAGFRCFSQFEEDGKLLFIFAALGIATGTFVDIGAADGILSNCANFALNFGWDGLFIDGNPENVRRGKAFYATHPDSMEHPPRFVHAMVTRENINDILRAASVPAATDLLSIDIDGNDYWVWDAIECTTPKVVIIETQIEFGMRDIVVPYDAAYVYPGRNPDYRGASVTAMARLAAKKGYRLVGSSVYGLNTIYVREGLAEGLLPAVAPETSLTHPRTAARAAGFAAIKDWTYLNL